MFRILFAMLLIFITGGFVFGQTPKCKFTVADAPSIHGLKLGMTAEEVFARFPGAAQDSQNTTSLAHASGFPNFGAAFIGVSPGGNSRENFEGIASYFLNLLDGKVVHISVQYAGPNSTPHGPTWPNLDELVSKFSAAYHLPGPSDWVDANGAKLLKCNGIEFVVGNSNGGAAQLGVSQSPASWLDELKKRRIAEEDRLRKEFKP